MCFIKSTKPPRWNDRLIVTKVPNMVEVDNLEDLVELGEAYEYELKEFDEEFYLSLRQKDM